MGEFDGQMATVKFGNETYQGFILETAEWFEPPRSLLEMISRAPAQGQRITFFDEATGIEIITDVPAEGLTTELPASSTSSTTTP